MLWLKKKNGVFNLSTLKRMEKLEEEIKRVSSRKIDNGISFKVRTGVPYTEIIHEQQEDGADLMAGDVRSEIAAARTVPDADA